MTHRTSLFFVLRLAVPGILFLCWLVGATPSAAGPTDAAGRSSDIVTGPEITISALDNEQFAPAVAYNSQHDEYLVVWQNNWAGNKDIYASRVSADGQVITGYAVAFGANDRIQPAVAYDPGLDRYLIVWSYDFYGDGSDYDLVGRFFPWDGPDPTQLEFSIDGTSASSQFDPQVAFALAQQEFLVVWTDSTSTGFQISYRRILADGSGAPIGPTVLSTGALDRVKPDVAYNLARNEYLVTWALLGSSFDIWAVRLRGDGISLGGGEFVVANDAVSEEHPTVAACHLADSYLLLYQKLVAGDHDVYGDVINGDGSIDSGGYLVAISGEEETMPDVTCDATGRDFVAVWQRANVGVFGTLQAWLFNRTTGAMEVDTIATGSTGEFTGPVAVGGNGAFLVAFEVDRAGTSWQDIHGVVIESLPMFGDDFETGDTNNWDSTIP